MSDKTILKTIWHSTTSQALASAALDFTTSIAFDTMVSYVSLRFSTAISETATISIDSGEGANYDVRLAQVAFTSRTYLFWQPDYPLYLKKNTELRIQLTNAGATGTVYVVVAQVQA